MVISKELILENKFANKIESQLIEARSKITKHKVLKLANVQIKLSKKEIDQKCIIETTGRRSHKHKNK